MKTHRTLKLALVGIGLFLFLGGPAPGSVGNCGEGQVVADPVQHCQQKEAWTCARRRARGDIDATEEAACVAAVPSLCSGANWPSGCTPTQQDSDACIAALMDSNTLGQMGQCFPDGVGCGAAPVFGPMCAPCDQPPACNLCAAGTGALTSADAGVGE